MNEEIVPILRVSDALRTATWYARLGFEFEWVHRFEPHLPAFVSVARGPMRIFLSEHTGDARPDTLIYLYVHDVHAIAAAFGSEVSHQDWGDEIELKDPDGNRIRINTPRSENDAPVIELTQAIQRDATDILQRLGFSEEEARSAIQHALDRGPHFRSAADLVQEALRNKRTTNG